MPAIPQGVVTLVFTDIEGSSALWEAHGAAFSPVLEAHNRLMRQAAANWNGYEVKTEGDAFFLAFSSACDAARYAVEAQISLRQFEWNTLLEGVLELRVRMGMHSGEPILAAHPDGTVDYFGPVVNRAARVSSAGYGGQILLSDATYSLAQQEISAEIRFENLGRHRLKGVGEETLWQAGHDALPSRFPSLRTLADAKSNLPPFSTPFIGRETEIEQGSALLCDPELRLLTLCGFGGQGKTRLALQIAENLLENFADGVWWVEVEAARDAPAMMARIAHELRLHLLPQRGVAEQLFEFLRERELLLVLDNTEQIERAGSVVQELLSSAPRLKCLVTTRRALEIRAERLFPVAPLAPSEAAALFADRARSRVADFVLNDENRLAIEELCAALEGVPLAIELAASRLSVLSPREMLGRLDERFRLLQSRAPDVPPRQRALRGAIDWSYELLQGEEKALLGALSVFSGGFSLRAAEEVSDDFEALEGVAQLTRHSFLRRETQGEATRFSMLESVRAYAAEKLAESGDVASVRARHRAFFLGFAEKIAKKLRTQGEARALDEFWVERENIGVALNFALENRDSETAARLSLGFSDPLYRLGFWDEARLALEKGLGGLERARFAALTAALQLRLASLAHDRGELETARLGAQDALQNAPDDAARADALNLLGLVAIDARENESARQFFEDSLQKRAISDDNGRAIALHNLALLCARRGETEAARQLYEAALLHRRAGGDARGEAETLGNLGVLEHNAGDLERASALYERSLELRRTLRDRVGIALMLHNLGEIAVAEADWERAVTLLTHSHDLFRGIGSAFAAHSQTELETLREKIGGAFEALQTAARAEIESDR